MTMISTYQDLLNQGLERGVAVRSIARSLYGTGQNARSFMAGFRASVKYCDGLEQREAKHAAQYGREAGNAYSDGWTLAACI